MLTRKKRLYADHREKGLGPRDAAVEAGYSQKYAKQCGYKLDRDPDVMRYREKQAARAAGAATPVGMDAVARMTEFIERTLGEPGLSDAEAARRVLRAQLHSDDERTAQNAAKIILDAEHRANTPASGKKAQKSEAAKTASAGKFGAAKAPALKSVK